MGRRDLSRRWTLLAACAALVPLGGCSPLLIGRFTSTSTANGPKLYAWGSSQTQGFGIEGCDTLGCHPATAWPQLFANAMQWTLDNQAFGSSDCADLTHRGTSLSIWDLSIDANSRNIYGHFRNDQYRYGAFPYRVAYARGCVEAQTAWLAIPETEKVRASSDATVNTGTWVNGTKNSASSYTTSAGATKTFFVSGGTVYLATARLTGGETTRYTVTVDGSLVHDLSSLSATFSQDLDVRGVAGLPGDEDTIQNFIRVSGLSASQHRIVYTCVDPGVTGCYLFYAAGVNSDQPAASRPVVYSLSAVYNSFRKRQGTMDTATTEMYQEAWKQMVSELDSDGLQVIGIDATDPNVYNPSTESLPDGVHPNQAGHISIATAAAKTAHLAESIR